MYEIVTGIWVRLSDVSVIAAAQGGKAVSVYNASGETMCRVAFNTPTEAVQVGDALARAVSEEASKCTK